MSPEEARELILSGSPFGDVYPLLDGASRDPDRPSPAQRELKEWFVRTPEVPRPAPFLAVNGHVEPSHVNRSRQLGFTGDACPKCGNLTLRRTGPCFVCLTCNESTGCN